jgi:hypothetical protein
MYDYVVNFTSHGFLQGTSSSNSSALVYFLPNGTIAAVYQSKHNYTGFLALSFGLQYEEMLFLVQSFGGNNTGTSMNATSIARYQVGSPENETVGSVNMTVTTYDLTIPNFNFSATAGTTTGTTSTATTTTVTSTSSSSSSATSGTNSSSGIIFKIGRIYEGGRLATYLLVYYYVPGLILLQVTNLVRASYGMS